MSHSGIFLELHVPDFDIARSFYEKLGFSFCWEEKENGGYLVMQKGKNLLNFYGGSEDVFQHSYFQQFPDNTQRGYGVEMILLVGDIEKYYEEVSEKIDTIATPLKLRPWGKKDFRLCDPFGYYWRISEAYDLRKKPLG